MVPRGVHPHPEGKIRRLACASSVKNRFAYGGPTTRPLDSADARNSGQSVLKARMASAKRALMR